jgi:hypothetical protein
VRRKKGKCKVKRRTINKKESVKEIMKRIREGITSAQQETQKNRKTVGENNEERIK